MEHQLTTSDQLKLYAQSWETEKKPIAIVVIVHGLGEHSSRYDHVAKIFTANGFNVFAFDQRGHGKSGGKKGHTPSTEILMDDIHLAILQARVLFGEALPLFLYGHSLGALEVLYFGATCESDLKGIIATSPPLDISSTPKSKVTMAKLMNPLFPALTMANALELAALSQDESVVEAYKADPLVHDKISVRLGYFVMTGRDNIFAAAPNWQYPMLLMHGTADRICGIKGTDELFEVLKGDITYKRWEGLYHETHNEPAKEEVIQTMVDWMKSRL